MCALAETAAQSSGQTKARFPEFIAQFVSGSESILPALLTIAIQQVDLRGLRRER